jgi:ribosomal protein S25
MTRPVGRPPIDRDGFMARLTRDMGRSRIIYVSPIRLEAELGISTRSIRRMLRELEDGGRLVLIRREGTRQLIYHVPE